VAIPLQGRTQRIYVKNLELLIFYTKLDSKLETPAKYTTDN